MAQASASAQARIRASIPGSTWSPSVSGAMMHSSRPWRSSPLAGPAFSTLPSIISESSEDSHEEVGPSENSHSGLAHPPSSSSVVSHAASASGSGCGTGYTSGNGSALAEGDASTSSISLSTSANGTSSSQGHPNTQSHRLEPARLSKSTGAIPTPGFFRRTPFTSEVSGNKTSISAQPVPPPRARTSSHRHSRSASLPSRSTSPPPQHSGIPQTYSPAFSRPISPTSHTDGQHLKQAPSTSRDPASNWMSSSPFGPATTPKFSRLAMASPSVVMPLSAKEYRKRKARESYGKGNDKELPVPPNHVSFADNVIKRSSMPLPQSRSGPPPAEPPRSTPTKAAPSSSVPPSSPGASQPRPDPESAPQRLYGLRSSPPAPAVPEPRNRPPSPSSVQSRPSSPKHTRSRPTHPRRSPSPPSQQPLSQKSSTNTFLSFAPSSSEDEATFPSKAFNTATPDPASSSSANEDPDPNALPAARPRPHSRRRKSYPDRRSGGARLSFVDAMNRLSEEVPPNRLSIVSQTNSMNRHSVVSQASGNTLFYDFVESGQEENEFAEDEDQRGGENHRTSALHTQSLEDLSSTLTRTGIEAAQRDFGTSADIDEHGGQRNVRMVRIADNVEVSLPPGPRRRKLTKTRPPSMSVRDSKQQAQERRSSLLPWISKGWGDGKGGAEGWASGERGRASLTNEGSRSSPSKGVGSTSVNGAPPFALSPVTQDPSSYTESQSTANGAPAKKTAHDVSTSKQDDEELSTPPRRARRYTFQFIPAPSFHRTKREKSKIVPDLSMPLGYQSGNMGKKKGKKGVESGFGTDSTSTVTLGSQSTLVPSAISFSSLHDPSTATPSRPSRASAAPVSRSVDVLTTAKDFDTVAFSRSFGTRGGDSTPSLSTSGSTTTTSSSAPGTFPSFVRHPTEPFVARPPMLKGCFTDTCEDDSEGVTVNQTHLCVRHNHRGRRPLSVMVETLKEDSVDNERLHPHSRSLSRPGTSSSTATTATSTSYVSFSTMPASTASSSSPSSSPSPSPSPSPSITEEPLPTEKPSEVSQGPTETHPCALCGHPAPVSVVLAKTPTAPQENGSGSEIHPMFAVPLVTITGSSASQVDLLTSNTPPARTIGLSSNSHIPILPTARAVITGSRGTGVGTAPATVWCQQASTPKSERSVDVGMASGASGKVPVLVPNAVARSVANGAKAGHLPSPLPTSRLKRPRPQTAPAGTGDAAFKFAEAIRARDLQGLVEVTGEHVVKNGGGESKWRAVLRGWLGRA
ncbi:hypothetical protein BS17DRAFT_44457 [Gyrodon lividus]|nr:hypothetical protein BS17DRAFT_44457 [Gyrodon lividus]